jgi:hypothetical protein
MEQQSFCASSGCSNFRINVFSWKIPSSGKILGTCVSRGILFLPLINYKTQEKKKKVNQLRLGFKERKKIRGNEVYV